MKALLSAFGRTLATIVGVIVGILIAVWLIGYLFFTAAAAAFPTLPAPTATAVVK